MANFQTFQLLTDVLSILTEVQKDPSVIKNWAEDAHRLGKENEDRLVEARSIIDTLPKLKEELAAVSSDKEKQLLEVASARKELSDKIAAHGTAVEGLNAGRAVFEKEKEIHAKNVAELDQRKIDLDKSQAAHEAAVVALIARTEAVAQSEAEIKTKWTEVLAYEAELKEKAAKSQAAWS